MVLAIQTGTISSEEVDGAKEASTVEAAVVNITIAETTQLLNICLKEK